MADSTQASTPSPASEAPEADPLLGDWSEGLQGPVRALGIPLPKLIALEGAPLEAKRPASVPVAEAVSEEVGTPDAWGAVGEDPLQSEPPPPLPAVMIAPEMQQEASLLSDVTPAMPAPAFLPDVTPTSPTPVFESVAEEPEVLQEEVVDLLPEDSADEPVPEEQAASGYAAEHHAAVQSEIETAEPIVEPEEPVTPLPEPEPEVLELQASDAEPEPEPAADAPVWDLKTTISKAPDWEPQAPPLAAEKPPDHEEPPAADWGSLSSAPDWSAPASAATAAAAGPAAFAAPAVSDDAWGAPTPAASWSNDAAWNDAAPAAPAAEWAAAPEPAPAAAAWTTNTAGANTLAQLEGEPEPIPAEPGAAEQLFGSVPVGGSLAEEDENELPAAEEVEDPDLPVAVEDPEPEPLVGLVVPGEHRVAVHTRGGRTRRGLVKDVDLSLSQFALAPQGGGADEPVYHAEVKAIFFMLPPGVSSRPGGHGKVKVTFADGRSIEGERDGSEGEHGFFLVPADAARTNTWRIYVAREATAEVRDL
jgi:hypothetical protein